MSDAPVPIFAFDVTADGKSSRASDANPEPAAGASWRWLHFDRETEHLAGWFAAHLPPLAGQTLLALKTRPRIEPCEGALLVTLRGINLNAGAELADMVSLRLWVSDTLVVSVRRSRVFAVEEQANLMRDGIGHVSPHHLLAALSVALVDRIESVSLELEDRADRLEERVYDHGQGPALDLPTLRRRAIKLRRHIGPMADALRDLGRQPDGKLPKGLRHTLRDVANRAQRALDEILEVHDRLRAISDHLEFAQAARQERNGYRLSIIAAIFLPLGFLTGVFGMNLAGMPGTQNPSGFWIMVAAMAATAALTAIVLRWLRWF